MKVEKEYSRLASEKIIARISSASIPDGLIRLFNYYKEYLPQDMTIEKFALLTWGFNAGRFNLGENAQINILKQKYKNIHVLPKSGKSKNKIFITKDVDNNYKISKTKSTNITNLHSFDAICEFPDNIILFILKTIDLDPVSVTKGGGGQDHQINELKSNIDILYDISSNNNQLYFNNKPVTIMILIDGRSALETINDCKNHKQNIDHLIINSVNKIIEE